MCASVGQGPSSSPPKQWKLDGCVKIYNSVSTRSALTKSKQKQYYREHSNTKAHVSLHWRAQCPAKWPRCGRGFQHSSGIELIMSPYTWRITLTTKPQVRINCPKKTLYFATLSCRCILPPCPVNAGHYMAFKHCISFASYLAANFGCYLFRIMLDIVSKLLRAAIWILCAVLFESAILLDRSSI